MSSLGSMTCVTSHNRARRGLSGGLRSSTGAELASTKITYNNVEYAVYIITSDMTITVYANVTVSILIVGGGGGGGGSKNTGHSDGGGGGGAGELAYGSTSLSVGRTYSLTIGVGGAGYSVLDALKGSDGTKTTFTEVETSRVITCNGGGRGGNGGSGVLATYTLEGRGQLGGSTGGSCGYAATRNGEAEGTRNTSTLTHLTSGGGAGINSSGGGGGGGAGSVGLTGSTSTATPKGGAGGGAYLWIDGQYYAGGGGGGAGGITISLDTSNTGGNGVGGKGGSGSTSVGKNGGKAAINTGSGGGGGSSKSADGGKGANGVIKIAVPLAIIG